MSLETKNNNSRMDIREKNEVMDTDIDRQGGISKEEGIENSFSKSRKVVRTPPLARQRINSLPDRMKRTDLVVLSTEDSEVMGDEDRPSKKRKAARSFIETPERSGTYDRRQVAYPIQKVKDRAAGLAAFCRQNANVHKEIQKIAAEMDTLMERVVIELNRKNDIEDEYEEENTRLREKIKQKKMRKKRMRSYAGKLKDWKKRYTREQKSGDTKGMTMLWSRK